MLLQDLSIPQRLAFLERWSHPLRSIVPDDFPILAARRGDGTQLHEPQNALLARQYKLFASRYDRRSGVSWIFGSSWSSESRCAGRWQRVIQHLPDWPVLCPREPVDHRGRRADSEGHGQRYVYHTHPRHSGVPAATIKGNLRWTAYGKYPRQGTSSSGP